MNYYLFLTIPFQLFFLIMLSAENLPTPPELTGWVVMPDQNNYETSRLVSNYYTSKNRHPDIIVLSYYNFILPKK